MKAVFVLFFVLSGYPGFGQAGNVYFMTGGNDYQSWSYKNFATYNVKKVEAYSFKINRRGKITDKKILLYRQQLDPDSNKVFGINCNTVVQSHGPAFLSYYNFRNYYNQDGSILKKIEEPLRINVRREKGSARYNINTEETIYIYNDERRLSKEVRNVIDNYYSIYIYRHVSDTFHLLSVHPYISEHFYNNKGDEISNYYTDDSTRYLPTERYKPADTNAVQCLSCDPRYLNGQKAYYDNGRLRLWTWYTREGDIHSKKYYFYDDSGRLTRQVDSTGWYFKTIEPYWERTLLIEYTDSGRVVTYINNPEDRFGSSIATTQTVYDLKGNVISECQTKDFVRSCTLTTYSYASDKLLAYTEHLPNGDRRSSSFAYNEKGLLTTRKDTFNGKLTQVLIYSYE